MSYSEFVNVLGNGCSLIFNSIVSFSNSLIHNYIFITILGLALIVSIVHLVSSFVCSIPLDNLDKTIDKYNDSKQKKLAQKIGDEENSQIEYPETSFADRGEL